MGGGSWSADSYASSTGATLRSGGSGFAYSDDLKTRPQDEWKVHEDLDPKLENKAGEHAGKNIREAMDSPEHPNSVAIAVLLDVTGSMLGVPQELIKKLPALHSLLQMKGYVEDPQVLFGAIGDATGDKVPLQVAQFESDNRMDEQLGNIVLEGNGQGGGHESYELAMYFMARHTHIDCAKKRDHKGYLFIIGDEQPYPAVKAHEVLRVIGDDLGGENISLPTIIEELQEKFQVFFIAPSGTSYTQRSDSLNALLNHWRTLIGPQNVIELRDLDTVAETIAVTVGVGEETVSLEQAAQDIKEVSGEETADTVSSALASVAGA